MISEDSISVIVPALNEEKSIETTIKTIYDAVKIRFSQYEVLIFNDGSTDRTAEIVDRLADAHDYIRVFHHKKPICIGGIYKKGIKLARMNYLIRINGKHDITVENLDKIFSLCKVRDLVIPYATNIRERSLFRICVSKVFTGLLNFIFGLKLKYYNHYVLCKRSALNSIKIQTDSYAFQAEILIKLIKSGCAYIEVPVEDKFDRYMGTKAFKFSNIVGVTMFLLRLIYEVYVRIDIEEKPYVGVIK